MASFEREKSGQHLDLRAMSLDEMHTPPSGGLCRAAIADGTHVELRENNLIGSRHIRYGGYGGIAYHHIADSYIALFTSLESIRIPGVSGDGRSEGVNLTG